MATVDGFGPPPKRWAGSSAPTVTMIEQIGRAIAKAGDARFEDNPERFRRLALAALKPLVRPTEAMIDAAYEAAGGHTAEGDGRYCCANATHATEHSK
jgi:hypothetical protein